MDDNNTWKIIDKYFNDNPGALVNHQLESYNDFFNGGINKIFREKNPISILKQEDPKTNKFRLRADLYIGGADGSKIYYGKPIIFDETREHYMYPNEARLRNFTYGFTIHYDVDVSFQIINDDNSVTSFSRTLEKKLLGRFPIMLQSDLCILKGLDKNVRHSLGECRNDRGGYFIIDGKEKVIISQEKFADNMIYIQNKVNDLYSHAANVRCVSEDASKPVRTLSIRIVAPTSKLSNNNIVVNVPNVRKPVPLFILMRALGITSDKSIIETCLLDMEKYKSYVNLFIPSVHDAGFIFTQTTALKFISTFTKGKTIEHVLNIISNYLLPQIGELNFRDKALYIGYMVFKLLKVFTNVDKPTDRDSFKYKRIETPGTLISELFKEYYTLQLKNIFQKIDKEYYYKQGIYFNNFEGLILNNHIAYFKDLIVENGFKKGFKGNWGSEAHTKRLGIVQELNRLSFNSYISLLRKINLPLDASAKIVGPRLLHPTQWGIIDPVDTPDGGNIGLHKYLSIMSKISKRCSGRPLIEWIRDNIELQLLSECSTLNLSKLTKLFVNHVWIGAVRDAEKVIDFLKLNRRIGILPIYMSISWEINTNTIFIYNDAGRLSHPVYYINKQTRGISVNDDNVLKKIETDNFTWEMLVSGFRDKSITYNANNCKIYKLKELYGITSYEPLIKKQAVIEFIDSAEEEGALIALREEQLLGDNYTHIEIHPSVILGIMGNLIIFPENNPLPRDLFSCGQSKQGVSLYHSNYQSRIDKSSLVLNYGQIPLLKSRYLKHINNEEHPYGLNAIVAIGCYGGFNVEDSILFNRGAIERGLFNTSYYGVYESREESSKVNNSVIDSRFANIYEENVVGLKPGYDYGDLNEFGLIRENTSVDDKKVLIGKVLTNLSNPNSSLDSSTFPKKGQLGFVEKSFITEGEEGFRLAKVKIREERIPAIGDKFCSRCGQKGTIGLIIDEENMPFTEDGIRPDLIINPHALPSRMTVGQLLETVIGKACSLYGAFGDCTAFNNKGSKYDIFGKVLIEMGFNSKGNEILYNGENGQQMDMNIFMGPTYYMRLKHLVKDKINYRAQGPRTVLTRQPVQGRANDGGLRIGELERDAIVAHGISYFLQESLLIRGDQYYMAVCNVTGLIAIYNPDINLFIGPMADGPIKFTGVLDDNLNIEKITKYGRSFSLLRVPYAFKLLIQELATLNIQMRIITDKNIDQLLNLSFTHTVDTILGSPSRRQSSSNSSRLESRHSNTSEPDESEPDESEPKSPLERTRDFVEDKIVDPVTEFVEDKIVEPAIGFIENVKDGTRRGIQTVTKGIQETVDDTKEGIANTREATMKFLEKSGEIIKTKGSGALENAKSIAGTAVQNATEFGKDTIATITGQTPELSREQVGEIVNKISTQRAVVSGANQTTDQSQIQTNLPEPLRGETNEQVQQSFPTIGNVEEENKEESDAENVTKTVNIEN